MTRTPMPDLETCLKVQKTVKLVVSNAGDSENIAAAWCGNQYQVRSKLTITEWYIEKQKK